LSCHPRLADEFHQPVDRDVGARGVAGAVVITQVSRKS
jgi:hypothetical protein